jgi:hypothetical protein
LGLTRMGARQQASKAIYVFEDSMCDPSLYSHTYPIKPIDKFEIDE